MAKFNNKSKVKNKKNKDIEKKVTNDTIEKQESVESQIEIGATVIEEPEVTEEALVELFEAVIDEETKAPSVREMIKDADFFSDKVEIIIWESSRRVVCFLKEKFQSLRKRFFKGKPKEARKLRRRELKIYRHYLKVKDLLTEKEGVFSQGIIKRINRLDKQNEAIAVKASVAAKKNTLKINNMREWADRNKRRLLSIFAVSILILFGAAAILNHVTAYEYSYNGRVLGLVKEQHDVVHILGLVSDRLSNEHNAQIAIDSEKDITFDRVISLGKDVDNTEQVLKKLTYMQNMTAKGYAIYIEGIRVAILDSEKSANNALDLVLQNYMTDNEKTTYEDVGFAEDIKIKGIDTKLGYIKNADEAAYKILTGAESVKTHTVQAGETFSGIASMYNIGMSELQATNPLVRPERLSIGQEIVLTQAAPMLTVQTVEITTVSEGIPFETTYENDGSMYQGESRVKSPGINGERSVTRKIVKNNGIDIASIELGSSVISNPSSAVVYVGTKIMPAKKGTGTFKYPVSGAKLTSKFGPRWGRMHYGLDLACSTGTRIKASDGGTVISSGYSGSYGYVVKIDHGGGFVSLYAHCSKLLVRSGEKVYQGQHIANVGSTGRSTGPHVHFEIQYMGTPKNPLNYL